MKTGLILLFTVVAVCLADVTVTPSKLSFKVGEDAVIPCNYSTSIDNPKITWYARKSDGSTQRLYSYKKNDEASTFRDGNTEYERSPPIGVDNAGSLTMSNVTAADNLLFSELQCEVDVGSDGKEAANVDVTIYYMSDEPADVTTSDYEEGKEGFVIQSYPTSIGKCVSPDVYPPAKITLYKNGVMAETAAENDAISAILNTATFTESETEKPIGKSSREFFRVLDRTDHQADFVCNVQLIVNEELVYSKDFPMPKFNVLYDTSMAEFEDVGTVLAGKPVTVKCVADGYPDPTIQINGGGAMIQMNVTKEDDGKVYECKAWNSAAMALNPIKAKNLSLTVFSLDVPVVTGDNVTEGEAEANLGASFKAGCNAIGKPSANLAWYKDDKKVKDSGDLMISSLDFSDSGDYECRASNGYEDLDKRAPLKLMVKGMRRVGEEMEKVTKKAGESAVLECSVEADTSPEFTWNMNEEKATTTAVGVKFTSQMEIGPLTAEDSEKEYVCTATSESGVKMEKTFKLPEMVEEVTQEHVDDKEISSGSATTAVIIVILVLILVVAIVVAVLYNKGIICKKDGEKGDESAEGDLEGGMHGDEAGNGAAVPSSDKVADEPHVTNPEEEKLMPGDDE